MALDLPLPIRRETDWKKRHYSRNVSNIATQKSKLFYFKPSNFSPFPSVCNCVSFSVSAGCGSAIRKWTTNCWNCRDSLSSHSKPNPASDYRSETSSNWSKSFRSSVSSISTFSIPFPAKNTSLQCVSLFFCFYFQLLFVYREKLCNLSITLFIHIYIIAFMEIQNEESNSWSC